MPVSLIVAKPAGGDVEATKSEAKVEKALDLIEDTRKVAEAANASGLTWTQAYRQRQRNGRIAANAKRTEARMAAGSQTTMVSPRK